MINPSLAESFNQGAVLALVYAAKHFSFLKGILWKSVLRLSYNPHLTSRKKKKNYVHSLSFSSIKGHNNI